MSISRPVLGLYMFRYTTTLWPCSAPQIFKISLLGSTIAALFLSAGCSSTPTKTASQPKSKAPVGSSGFLDASSLDSLEDLLSATDMRAVEGDRLLILKHGDVWKRMTVGFKMDETKWDPRIEAQRNWFISRQPYLDRLSARASRYLYHTVKEAERRGMPTELALLPVIESSYDPAATSSASAAGLWQFIPSTGRIYGLQQSGSYDARRDVVESTRAAYEFLGSLYNQFGSWELALAAYNAGPGRVQQAINRNAAAGLPTDYWSLKLPAETMNYVPRFLAVAQIIKNPRQYNVTLPPIANRPHFREIQVQAGVSLTQIAELSGLTRQELYTLNPGYRGDFVDTASPGRILIPSDVNLTIDKKISALQGTGSTLWANTTPPKKIIASSTGAVASTVVLKPSTSAVTSTRTISTPKDPNMLAKFANDADVPSAPRIPIAVTNANNLKQPVNAEPPISNKERDRILAELVKTEDKQTVNEVTQPVANKAEQQQVINEIKAIVPEGTEVTDPYDGKIKLTAIQTSQSIADSEGKEVTKSFSYPKNVADSKDTASHKSTTDIDNAVPKGKRSTYTVMAGDTLAVIAMKNGVSWRDIAKWNQIDPSAPLYVGNILYLYDAKAQASTTQVAAKPEVYIVKAGDTLSAVSNQFDIPLRDLADWNDLSINSNVMVGQRLILRATKDVASSSKSSKSSKAKTSVYVVKRGEYLKLIADRYGLSNQELAELTPDLSASSSLMVGQKINVPVAEKEADTEHHEEVGSGKTQNYKVKHGESFAEIANRVKLSVTELAKLNRVKASYDVKAGQTIKIPANVQPDEYVVKKGDRLASIAEEFNMQPAYLAKINGLSTKSSVRAGQHLKLTEADVEDKTPVVKNVEKTVDKESSKKTSSSKATESYTAKSGDSLHSVANRYGVSVKELADLNDLSIKTSLKVGQSLNVPKKTVSYKVKSGDNLIKLANRYGIDVKDLAEMNNLTTKSALKLGTTIQVPNR